MITSKTRRSINTHAGNNKGVYEVADNRPNTTSDPNQLNPDGSYKMIKGSKVGVSKALASGKGNLKRAKGMGGFTSGGGR